ncbi:MAG: HD domain-containing phosphohydrolase [Pyrinomonadaceae bacterium]
MERVKINSESRVFQTAVTVVGNALWLWSCVMLCATYALPDQLTLLLALAAVVVIGMFQVTFRLPSGLKFTRESFNFSLGDAVILLIACWYGFFPTIFVAGIEGFTSSRRSVRRLSSNFFSSSMLSLAAAAAAASLGGVLHYGFDGTGVSQTQTIPAVAVAILVASVAHIVVNWGLLSTLMALRYGNPILRSWKEGLVCAAPMFLPTSAVASLIHLSLQYSVWMTVVIGGPFLVTIYLVHRQYRDHVQERINLMENSVRERISIREKSHRETIEALAVAINAKDEVTHEHVMRVQVYAAGVARLLGCNEEEIEALRAGALLHDIGKIAVPDYILNKPGKLTAAEFEKMKVHTNVGAKILGRVEFPYPVVPVVRHHHERWDGKGYPDSLSGDNIPLTARILSVVDCFDAVREDRQYRRGMTREEAINFIMQGSGSMYDPRVVGTFITHLPEFEAEILARRGAPVPTFGIEPDEQLSEAARMVLPAAGLAEASQAAQAPTLAEFSHLELSALYELARSMNATRGRDEVFAAFMDKLRALVPYDSCAITLAAPQTGENVVAYAAGEHQELLKGRRIAVGEGVVGWVLANQQPFCNTDPKLDLPPTVSAHFAAYRTLAVFPLVRGEETYGAVALYSSALAEYSGQHQRLLKEAVALAAEQLSKGPEPVRQDVSRHPVATVNDSENKPAFNESSVAPGEKPLASVLTH